MSTQNQTLNTCGCCEGIKVLTPVTIDNQPGLSALAYRTGTWGSFLKSMLAEISGEPALAELTTREADDPAIGLLDAWATLLDVLTAENEHLSTQLSLATSQVDQVIAAVRMRHEAGIFQAWLVGDVSTTSPASRGTP